MDPVQPNAAAVRLLNDVLEEGGAGSVLESLVKSKLKFMSRKHAMLNCMKWMEQMIR